MNETQRGNHVHWTWKPHLPFQDGILFGGYFIPLYHFILIAASERWSHLSK